MAVFDKITEGIGAGYQFDLQTHPNPRHFKFGHQARSQDFAQGGATTLGGYKTRVG